MIRPLAETEKEEILNAIIETGCVVDAAIALGIGKSTIYRKMQLYGLAFKANQIIAELRRQKSLRFVPKGKQSKYPSCIFLLLVS